MKPSTIGRRIYNNNSNGFLPKYYSPFSTSSGGGRGRGCVGPSSPLFDSVASRAPGRPESDGSKSQSSDPRPPPSGHGRGRGFSDNPTLPSFSNFISKMKSDGQRAIGRGRGVTESAPSRPLENSSAPPPPKKTDPVLPAAIHSALSGAGRGKSIEPAKAAPEVKEENRHIRPPPAQPARPRPSSPTVERPKLTREEAVRKAMNVLSSKQEKEEDGGGDREVVSRGRGRGRERGQGRGEMPLRGRRDREDEEEDDDEMKLDLGDDEKLAKRLGTEKENRLLGAFDEMIGVLPPAARDAYLDALDTNFKIELEPEWLMGVFDRNPDIYDKGQPMPIRDMLEKLKPFLMKYEGFQTPEEWEEAIEKTMENVPLLNELVEHYSGLPRVTAKKQQEELERVANTIPLKASPSVKQFTDRAVLSLQSNPGWGFKRKSQFMNKLVREVSEYYK